MFVKHVYPILLITLLPAIFCTFFAIPFGRDQPTEVWALAKLHFLLKPRRRIWDQSGIKELVTITVPKKVERVLTKGFSQSEVESRLKALANTLDTRGWAVKNINAGPYTPPHDRFGQSQSDRLIDIGTVPQEVPGYDVQASDDILDETSNPVAQQFQTMINQASKQHRQHIMDELNEIKAEQGQPPASKSTGDWFMSNPATIASSATTPTGNATTSQLPQPHIRQPLSYSHMRTLKPVGQGGAQPASTTASPPNNNKTDNPAGSSGTDRPDPAILSLANNNDLNVSTLARQANKATHGDEQPRDEVVVSLH